MSPPLHDPRRLAAAAWLCGLALAAPPWVGRILPLLDLPQHLAVVSVLRHYEDPGWGFARFFEIHPLELTPYWTYYLMTGALSFLFSVETASRIVLSAYALAFPWAGVSLCRAFGRSPWLGLLAAPLALNTNLYFGFVSYSLGVLLMTVLVAAFERHLERRDTPRAWALALVGALLFFTHVQAFAAYVAVAGLLALTRTEMRVRERLVRLWPLVPATVGLLLPWVYIQFVGPRDAGRRYSFGHLGSLHAAMRSPWASLRDLPDAVAGAFQDGSDAWLLALWMALILWAGVRGTRALLPAGLALLAYFVAPMSIAGQWNIGPRFAWLAALLLLPALRAEGRRAAAIGAAGALLTVAVSANAAWHHVAFDREAGGFDQAMEAIPRGVRVMPLVFDNRGAVMKAWPYLHVGQYAMVRRGGMAAFNLGRIAGFPIRLRDADALPYLDVFRPQDFRFESVGRAYDFFLVRDAAPVERVAQVFPPASVEVVFASGEWMVLRRR